MFQRASPEPRGIRASASWLLVLLLAGGAAAQQPREVRLNDPEWAPYFFGDSDPRDGLAKEILELCLTEASYAPRFKTYPTERMHAYMHSGELDINVFSHREDRKEFLYYGQEPLFADSYHPVVRADSGIEIHSLSDFDPLELGHILGLQYSPEFKTYVDAREAAGSVTVVSDTEHALAMLAAGRIDVFVSTEANLRFLLREEKIEGIAILDYVVRTGDYFVTVSKRSPRIADPPAFLEKIDGCIAGLKEDGRYEHILNRYR